MFFHTKISNFPWPFNQRRGSPDPSKIKCIKNYPKPKNAKDIKSFLDLLNYYRRFVDDFANP
jgi:hypothetical protein